MAKKTTAKTTATNPKSKKPTSAKLESTILKTKTPKTTTPKTAKGASGVSKSSKAPAISGTKESPWTLKTPSGQSEFKAFRDESLVPPALVVIVGKTELRYHLSCINDLHAMLKKQGDWMLLGSADEQKPAKDGTVESWARAESNPARGWYGLKKGLRGRFANYVPPVLQQLGLAEVENKSKDNRMRAL